MIALTQIALNKARDEYAEWYADEAVDEAARDEGRHRVASWHGDLTGYGDYVYASAFVAARERFDAALARFQAVYDQANPESVWDAVEAIADCDEPMDLAGTIFTVFYDAAKQVAA